MQIWNTLILLLQIASALIMIGLVLIQHGKGADMGASFGSGASGSLFGATGSANFMSRATAVCATVFFLATLTLAYMGNSASGRSGESASVLDRAPAASAASSASGIASAGAGGTAAPATPGAIPGALPGTSAVTPSAAATVATAASATSPAASTPAGQIPK